MKSKVLAPVVWSLVLGVLMLGLAACGSKEDEPKESASSGKPQASQPASPTAAPAPDADSAQDPVPASVPAPVQAKLNAAEFLTRADAEAVLGKPVSDASVQGDGVLSSSASYVASDFTGIGLFVRAGTEPHAFDQAQAMSKSVSNVDPVPVAGLGEKAYWAAGKMNQLNVLKNKHWIIITVPAGGDKALDLAKLAAEKALPRVP
jgi:hypothetical protein